MPESSYRLIILLALAFPSFAVFNGMEIPQKKEEKVRPQVVSRKRFNESLYNKKSEAFKKHCSLLIYCKTLLEQGDPFSCGYRALFNAKCLQIATDQAAIRGNSVEENLEPLLKNENSFNALAKKLQDHISQTDPTYNLSRGMSDRHLVSFVEEHLSTLKARILPIYLTDKKVTIKSVNVNTETYSNIDQSVQLHNHLSILAAPFESAHFACLLPRHWILASIITDAQNVAKLYVMDSNNSYLENNPNMTIMIKKLLEYVEEVNARNNFFISVDNAPRPPAQSAPVPR